ncbi:hypothetical protein SAMN05192583_0124 [Sphingomonas gellani]|uniref:Uncharacterized protein n=1 Tax=Sphingomonas gellani TaxID=1166340 RepID=A0A1H7Y9E3_9SPHN|nr:hypothetical protein SAMN05192583_0124 [Sphingomonas gellani]
MVGDGRFRTRNVQVLREAQNALNIAFGAILSAYVGNSLAEIDNRPFDHHALARFFIAVAVFILGLCVANSAILRGEYRLGLIFAVLAAGGATAAHHEGAILGFEVIILRVLAGCWIVALVGSNVLLTAITYLHHRKRT